MTLPAAQSTKPFRVTVPGAHPALADHFVGRPIVPGALLLTVIQARLSEQIGQSLCEISKLRFNHAVLPDQTVLVRCEQKAAGQWRFRGLVNGKTVVKGIFHAGGSAALGSGEC
ncbi:MAG: hypothetical protein ACR2PS_01740 [Pseudomonadales bacterium]